MKEWIRSCIWKCRSFRGPRFDHARRIVYLRGRSTCLQDTTWKVLKCLLDAAPGVVSRTGLIEAVWGNRWRTGEKGLNQAVWQIRTALGDEARTPRFLQTIPRSGYRWLGSGSKEGSSGIRRGQGNTLFGTTWHRAFFVLPLLALPLSGMFSSGPPVNNSTNSKTMGSAGGALNEPVKTAVAAYLDPLQRIVVDLESGCRGLIVPTGDKRFANPAISADGGAVVFTVRESNSCKTVTLQLSDNSRQEFENCPVKI